TVTSSENPSTFGDSISFTATISSSAATGTVQFKIDGNDFGSPAAVTNGSAMSGSTSSVARGNHTVTATYSGDSNFAGSTGTLTQTVNTAPTTTTVSSSENPSTFGDSISFTATISSSAATGTVQFKIDGNNFGSPAAVTNGSAMSGST